MLSWLLGDTTPRQLRPKDLLEFSKKIEAEEAERRIMDAVKKHSVYSHSNYSNQFMMPSAQWGTSSTASIPISTGLSYSPYSTIQWSESGSTYSAFLV